MAQGLFTLRQQVQGIVQKAWIALAGTSAGVFNGTSQYLTVPYSSAFNFGTGDFTIEGWINLSSLSASYYVLAGTWTTGTSDEWLIQIQNNNTIRFLTTAGTSFYSATLTTGVWYHIAGVRSGSTITLYVNGASVGSYTNANSIGSVSKTVYIGAQQTPIWYMNGYISNFRIVKGTALYTSNFAIPSAPLGNITGTSLLTLQNATIIDNSSNASTITNVGSVTTSTISPTAISVNGLSTPAVDYLVVAGGGGSGFGLASGGGAGGLLQGSVSITTGSPITVTIGGGGPSPQSSGVGNSGSNSVFSNITTFGGGGGGSWAAVAGASGGSGGGGASTNGTFVSGGQGVFGQGNAGGSITSLYAYHISGAGGGGAGTPGGGGPNLTNTVDKGAYGYAGGTGVSTAIIGPVYAFAGGGGGFAYGDGIGIATGGAGGAGGGGAGGCAAGATNVYAQGGVGYNSGGTPSAVWNGGNGGTNTGGGGGGASIVNGGAGGAGGSGIVVVSYPDIYAAAASTTGSPTVSTSGSGSVAFSGTGQYLSTPSNSGFAFGTGDLTVEAWIYANSLSGERGFFQTSATAGGLQTSYTDGLILVANPAGNGINANLGNTTISTGNAITINTWYHVAFTRSSGSCRLFINGVLFAGPTNITTNVTGTYAAIGGYYTNSFLWNGNISNLRVVKGTAVYTSAFTPSTVPLTAISGTSLLMNTVSGAQFADSSSNSLTLTATGSPTWNQLSPFATGLGYKNRVYTWTSSGTVTF